MMQFDRHFVLAQHRLDQIHPTVLAHIFLYLPASSTLHSLIIVMYILAINGHIIKQPRPKRDGCFSKKSGTALLSP